jgi:hypothetical protein
VPADYLPIVAKALAKNPAHRYASMSEMARAVENIGREPKIIPVAQPRPRTRPIARPVPPPKARPRPEPIPVVLPVIPLRQQIGELTGSMALAAGLALLGTLAWGILGRLTGHPGHRHLLSDLGLIFFLAVGASWVVLVPAKFWDQKPGSSWYRRLVMMFLGILLGLGALWLSGASPGTSWVGPGSLVALVTGDPRSVPRSSSQFFVDQAIKYVGYFALVFFLLRWWRMAELHRARRFSLLPVITAFFWGVLPLPLCPASLQCATVALVMTAVIVQMVSPCVPLVTAVQRRLRLRHT